MQWSRLESAEGKVTVRLLGDRGAKLEEGR